MSQNNGAIVKRWFEEVWNQRRAETIAELVTPESVYFTDEGSMRGPLEFQHFQYEPLIAAFPDLRVEIEAMIAQGDQVAVRWCATGTHMGDGLGFPATLRHTRFRGTSWIRVRDGKFMEARQSSNVAETIRRLATTATVPDAAMTRSPGRQQNALTAAAGGGL